MCAVSLCEEIVLSKLCVLSRFTGVCLFPQLCGCRVCVSRFFCVFQAVPSPLLSHWQCQYQTAPRASMPQRRQSESITPDLWPHSFGKMFSFLSATLSLFLCCFLPFSFKSYLPIGLWIYIYTHNIVTWGSESGLFKEIVHPKMKILSLSTHPHVVPNLRSSSEHKLRCFWWYRRAIWHSIDSNTEMKCSQVQKGSKYIG